MTQHPSARLSAVIILLPLFAACGGGGSDAPPTSPNPGAAPGPTPPASRAVVVFPDPVPGQYASLGSSTTSPQTGHPRIPPFARLTNVAHEDALQPRLRYTSSRKYEIGVPGVEFDELEYYEVPAGWPAQDHLLQTSNAGQRFVTMVLSQSRLDGYRHSEMANWYEGVTPRSGSMAFGVPTPSAAIAASGNATYRGRLSGFVDVPYIEMTGEAFFSDASGTIVLTVDFATRTISGTIEAGVQGGMVTTSIPFSTTTILAGTDTWRGTFETSDSGFNEFKVMLTGPDAGELIGSWSVPITVDGEPHQFMGSWIAKRQ